MYRTTVELSKTTRDITRELDAYMSWPSSTTSAMEISGIMLKCLQRVMTRDTQSTYLLWSSGGKRGMDECQKHHRRLNIYVQREGTQSGTFIGTGPARRRPPMKDGGYHRVPNRRSGLFCLRPARTRLVFAVRDQRGRGQEVRELWRAGVIEPPLMSQGSNVASRHQRGMVTAGAFSFYVQHRVDLFVLRRVLPGK